MPKFNPGDPVWAQGRCTISKCPIPPGENAAVITRVFNAPCPCITCKGHEAYGLDICPGYMVCVCVLRPRRDDYQQHEGLGSRDQLDDILYHEDNVPVLDGTQA